MNKDKNLEQIKKQIKIENFLLISGKTLGVSVLVFLSSWIIVPIRSICDARKVSHNSSRSFLECLPDTYNSNVYRIAQMPFDAYISAKANAEQRLKEFNQKQK